MKHADFRKGGMISVWAGNFSSDVELDNYLNLNRQFEEDFGFELNERDMPETSVKTESVPIRELVKGFSWSESYAESVVALAQAQGIERATTMVIFFNFQYEPERAKPKGHAPVTFVGVVPFS